MGELGSSRRNKTNTSTSIRGKGKKKQQPKKSQMDEDEDDGDDDEEWVVEAVEDDVGKRDSNKADLRVFMIAIAVQVLRERVWADPQNFGE